MLDLFIDFSGYSESEPAGVELPAVSLDGELLGKTSVEALRYLCLKGVETRGLSSLGNKAEYYNRVKYELGIFEELGFTDYILLNWDIINFCHQNDIPVGDARGSAAGSLVLFLIGVTNIDPIKNGLFFERFVSKNRAKKIQGKDGKTYLDGSLLADIDNDISYEHRDQVIEYIEKRFLGRTAKILTFNTLTSKSCIGEAAKYFNNADKDQVDQVSSMIPVLHGKVFKLKKSVEESEQFKEWTERYPEAFRIALMIEGLIKNTSVHASGIAICAKPIRDVIPLQKVEEKDTKKIHLITGYDMDDVASLMVKFDILGLRTLSFVHRACKRIGIKRSDIDTSDPFIYRCLQDVESPFGLFQISASTNFEVTKKVKPESLAELSDVVALARPGALAFVDQYVEQKKDSRPLGQNVEMDEILSQSKNVLLYQEQVMAIAHKVFGLTLDEAEMLRRIIGKKKIDEVHKWKEKIFQMAESRGLSIDLASYFFDVVEASASYQFNKSHSVSYASLAAQTVYLKFKYPAEFFLSILELAHCFQDPLKMVGQIQRELKMFGMNLMPPDLKKSELDFTIEPGGIRYGLTSIKGISNKKFAALIEFRKTGFHNKYDIFLSAKASGLDIGVLVSLVFSGALGSEKRSLLALEAQAFNLLTDREKRNFIKLAPTLGDNILIAIDRAIKDGLLADDGKPLIKPSRFETFKGKYYKYKELYSHNSKHERFCAWWFEMYLLGYSYSFSLKECFQDEFNSLREIASLQDVMPNSTFRCVGVVADQVYTNTSRNGNKYARFPISDSSGEQMLLFCDNRNATPLSDFLEGNELLKGDIVVVSGSSSRDGSGLFVNNIHKVDTKIFTSTRQIK